MTRKELYIWLVAAQIFAASFLYFNEPWLALFPLAVSLLACVKLILLNIEEKDDGGGPLSPA